jgi:hypothetical protein
VILRGRELRETPGANGFRALITGLRFLFLTLVAAGG